MLISPQTKKKLSRSVGFLRGEYGRLFFRFFSVDADVDEDLRFFFLPRRMPTTQIWGNWENTHKI